MNETRADLDPARFAVHRTTVRDDVELAYVREGVGGVPLVLLHGWPETKRIWWRNVAPLADAGFEVIVPDLRGFGDSPIPTDGFYDLATMSRDVRGLLHALGHESAVFAGGDYGGMTIQDLGHRFPEVVRRQVLFNCVAPMLEERYAEHGVGGDQFGEINAVSDHVLRHGNDADGLASELTTDRARRSYVDGFYTYRLWGHHGSFAPEHAAFMSEPFGDAERFRASLVLYEAFTDPAKVVEPPILTEPHAIRTLILYGQSDRVVGPRFPKRMELACRDRVGPFLVEEAGHFLQYERAELFNEAVRVFCLDLLGEAAADGGTAGSAQK